jgi:transcriptional regulator with GAF, ATPase, and Fis domain
MMDQNVFFREAVTHITSTLEIATALQRCVRFFSTVMPADIVQILLWEQDLCALRVLASATATTALTPDELVPVAPADSILPEWSSQENVRIVNNLESPISQRIQKSISKWFNFEVCSHMVLRVQVEGRRICDVAVVAEGRNRFNESHATLLELLRTPFGIAVSNALRHRELELIRDRLAENNQMLKEELDRLVDHEVVGAEAGMKQVMEQVVQVARTDAPVLLLGETGVGKDVVAMAIQRRSPRKDAPFVRVNCGAIPDSLLDSELFGHEKGAFTGAQGQRKGRFERAHGGTIFLDEVGELSLSAQVKLLRVLQNGEMERVGGVKTISVNTRVIAATNRDLRQLVHDGEFRQDLFFRLNVFPISIPPLRDRRGDIPLLVDTLIRKIARTMNLPTPKLAPGEIHKLLEYDWPGNVRELANIIEQAIIRTPQGPLRPLVERPADPEILRSDFFPRCGDIPLPLDDVIRHYLTRILAYTDGKISGENGAARLLAINPHTLRSRLDRLGVSYKKRP